MRVSIVGYLNSLPFHFAVRGTDFEVYKASPRHCGLQIASGEVDAALVPVRHAWALEDLGCVKPFGDLGIAINGETRSTLLIGPADLRDKAYGRLLLDDDSSSAAALTRLLLSNRFGHRKVRFERDSDDVALPKLLIGDRALRMSFNGVSSSDSHIHDIGKLWKEWTGLPFVYARWVLRSTTAARDARLLRSEFDKVIGSSGILGGQESSEFRRYMRGAAKDCGIPVEFVADYLSRIAFRFGEAERAGEERFQELCSNEFGTPNIPIRSNTPTWWAATAAKVAPGSALEDRPARQTPSSLRQIRRSVIEGARISLADGIYLLAAAPLSEIVDLAAHRRQQLVPGQVVTFVIDTNPNYTNVCDAYCSFCAFYRPPGRSEGAYQYDVDEMIARFREAVRQGATTILLQGGHHPTLPLEYYVELVRRTREEFPGVMPHFWSAGEIRRMAQVSGLAIEEVLARLYQAGQRSLPGGGAEILTERVRDKISPLKGTPEEWLEVHRIAHEIGMKSTATMMYGHVESPADIVQHLVRLRSLQDRTGGFTAFIPWSFKPGNTPLARQLNMSKQAGTGAYLRVIAVSRLMLDNFPHVQTSFFSEGWDAGQLALHAGADDVGGVLIEENVHKAAGYVNPTPLSEVKRYIVGAGFLPTQRDTLYNLIETDLGA